jgi:hypothetical protein
VILIQKIGQLLTTDDPDGDGIIHMDQCPHSFGYPDRYGPKGEGYGKYHGCDQGLCYKRESNSCKNGFEVIGSLGTCYLTKGLLYEVECARPFAKKFNPILIELLLDE